MIPSIGIMIGCYVITRMTSFATRSGDRAESNLVKGFAVVTILVTALVIATLLTNSSPSLPNP